MVRRTQLPKRAIKRQSAPRHPADRFERRRTRRIGWDLPSLVGLAGSIGSPGLGLTSAAMTSRCWAFALGGAGVSHLANAAWCRRRRSIWSGPAYLTLAGLGLLWGMTSSWARWDNLWVTAFVVWLGCYSHDRRRPHRLYRRRRVIAPFATTGW
jgi:hypothetical protein